MKVVKVLGVILVVLILLGIIVVNYAKKSMVNMIKRGDNGGMKVNTSFYDLGPTKPLAEAGVKFMEEMGHTDLYMESFDGLKLHAYYFKNPNADSKKFFLGMHGYKSGPRYEYGPYIKKYLDLGFNVILPDERAHYLSEGEYLTMGANESIDTVDWAKYIVKHYGEDIEILIQGISMGGATVCLASSLDLPSQVIGIVSDCAYSSFKGQMEYTMKHDFKMPTWPLTNIMEKAIKKKAGFTYSDVMPIEHVKNAKVPMIFFHGENDEMVPVKFANELYEACGAKKKLVIVKGANHAESASTNLDEYFKNIVEFFNLEV